MSLQYDLTKAVLGTAQHTNDTARVIRTGCKHFADYCKCEGFNKMGKIQDADPRLVIQGYADFLVEKGYSPATIHTYLYGPCRAFDIEMGEIRKPKRTANSIKRSRDEFANKAGKIEAGKPEYARLVEFQSHVGIRRAELARLTGGSLTHDESGHLCVEVKGGKGGKDQLQRILPADEQYVKDFFRGLDKNKYVFNSTEMRNHIDLHALRAEHARKAYEYYAGMSPTEKLDLREELSERWLACHPGLDRSSREYQRWRGQMDKGGGIYRLRGNNYDRAVRNGRPTSYDRVAVVAVSAYALSHWRESVTITNYLI